MAGWREQLEDKYEEDGYIKKLRESGAANREEVADLYDATPKDSKVEIPGKYAGAAKAAQTLSSGGSVVDAAGSGMVSAGVATANPYLIGAGAVMGVLGAGAKKDRERAELEAAAKNADRDRKAASLSMMADMYQKMSF